MTDEVYVLRKQGKKWKIPENGQENDKILQYIFLHFLYKKDKDYTTKSAKGVPFQVRFHIT